MLAPPLESPGRHTQTIKISYGSKVHSQVARNAELCRLKFCHAQQHPNTPMKPLQRLFRLLTDKGRDFSLLPNLFAEFN